MNALITNVINNFFHMVWFYCIVAEPKHSRRKTAIISVAVMVLSQLLSLILMYGRRMGKLPLSMTESYFIGYLIGMFIYIGAYVFLASASHPAKSLFLVTAYLCLWSVMYSTISLITNTYAGAGNAVIWALRIGLNLVFLIPYLLFFRKRLFQMYKEVKSGYWLIATLSLMCFAMQSFFLLYNDRTRIHNPSFIVLIVFSYGFMVAVYAMVFRYISQSDHVHRMKQLELNERFLLAQIDSYETMAENVRQTRHDFRHHNMVVMEYAKNNDYQGILDYLQEYEERETEKYTGTFCKNHAVDTVLSAYVSRCEQNGIEVSTHIRMEEPTDVSDYDMVTILANILENAVNGCMKADGMRSVEISVRQRDSKLIIVCKNTCERDILFEDGLPKSREHDGIGVESIISTIKKYGGDVDFSAEDRIFMCRVILNNKRVITGQ